MRKSINHAAVLTAVLICVAASSACSYSGSVSSSLAYSVPGQQVADVQQSDQQQQPAARKASGL